MAKFRGTNNADTLTGSNDADLLLGLGQNDFLNALGGNDVARGDTGNDTILGGDGKDFLDGGKDNDVLIGEAGNDTLFGGSGNDRLDAGKGNDVLFGGSGNDVVDGNSGDDQLDGGSGDDAMRGDDGNDLVLGGAGQDVLLGEAGDDTLDGGDGDDVINGDNVLRIFGLTDQNTLVSFDPNRPDQVQTNAIAGVDGKLIGIDFRPANGILYGLSDTNKIYTIDPKTGNATFTSQLNVPFNGGAISGVDFNPVPDRLRVVGSNDQNFRLNVDTGAVADFDANTPGIQPDRPLAYAPGDVNFGKNPTISAAAYTNSFAPSPDALRKTTLYEIDSDTDALVRQGGLNFPDNPPSPNEGQLFTIGNLGVDFKGNSGFDILSAPNGQNVAVAVSGATLYSIDLTTGKAEALGNIGDGKSQFIGLAVTGLFDPSLAGNDRLHGGNGKDTLAGSSGNDTLKGGADDDALLGEMGNDSLIGGSGNDQFIFSSNQPFSTANLGVDRIKDFQTGDKIVLDQTVFGAITPAQVAIVASDDLAGTNAGSIVYSLGSGNLFFNADGATAGFGSGGAFAKLENLAALTTNDFVIIP